MRGVRRAWPALLCAVVLLVATAGCGNNVEGLSFGKPPAVKQGSANQGAALPGNLNGVAQAGIPGQTTTTVATIGPGSARIIGTVFGPNGPIGGATVEADRLVGNQVARTTVTTAADGSFVVGSILGGRYRVRAWQAPTLALTQPEIFFLGSAESHPLALHLDAFTGPDVADSVNPTVLIVGDMANLLVQVTNPAVGSDGVVRDQPDPGVQVTLVDGPAWTVDSSNPLTTGNDGRALFQISCSSAGSNPLSVEVGTGSPQPLSVPDCVEPAPPTTQCSPPTTGNGGVPTDTSTTQPNGGC
jgi:hypothetical protein